MDELERQRLQLIKRRIENVSSEMLADLSPRQRDYIRLRFGLSPDEADGQADFGLPLLAHCGEVHIAGMVEVFAGETGLGL